MRRTRFIAPLVVVGLAITWASNAPPSALGRPRQDGSGVPEAERAALVFVDAHHPELARLLRRLRSERRDEYAKAIEELTRTRAHLERLRQRDSDRHALALDAWKARSRVELLTARLVGGPDSTIEAELRQALADQVAVQLRLQRHDREQVRARLEQLDRGIQRLETEGDTLVASRYEATLKRVRRLRRQTEAPPSGVAPSDRSNRPPGGPTR